MTDEETPLPASFFFLKNGGEMGERIRTFCWLATPLGAPQNWPASLRNILSLMLNSRFPMFLFWGPAAICFYNDAYRPSLGNPGKHPAALGQRGEDTWQEIWHIIQPWIQQVMSGGESVWYENTLIPIYRNGAMENVYWTFNYSAVPGETGQPDGVLVICQETTEAVVATEKLKKAKEEFEGVIEAAELGTFDLDMATGKLMCNPHTRNWFGLAEESDITIEKMMSAIADWDRPRIADEVAQLFSEPAEGVVSMTYTLINPNQPHPRYVQSRGKMRYDETGNRVRFAGTIEDITHEISAREAMEASRKQLEEAYEQVRLSKEAAALGMFDMDLKRGTLDWDARCRELFGISHRGPVTYEHDFLLGLHPDDKERISRLIDNLFIREISNGDYDVEYRTVGFEDGKIRWVKAKGKVFFNEADEPVRFIGSVLDITDSKREEERKNTFVGIVSHELKTPLTTITAYIQMLKGRELFGKDEFAARALEKTEAQLVRMRSLVDGFLNLSRLEAGKIFLNKEVFVLPDLIRELVNENTLTVTTHPLFFHPALPLQVNADRIKIGNVLSNLISNAIKYSERGKPIQIWCKPAGNHIEVSVQDEGFGLHANDIQQLFTRFYRVQNKQTANISGFGIGLYLCAEIVERHGGKIWVESEVSKGSTFYFTLPVE